jgi:hypothetical protein
VTWFVSLEAPDFTASTELVNFFTAVFTDERYVELLTRRFSLVRARRFADLWLATGCPHKSFSVQTALNINNRKKSQ